MISWPGLIFTANFGFAQLNSTWWGRDDGNTDFYNTLFEWHKPASRHVPWSKGHCVRYICTTTTNTEWQETGACGTLKDYQQKLHGTDGTLHNPVVGTEHDNFLLW